MKSKKLSYKRAMILIGFLVCNGASEWNFNGDLIMYLSRKGKDYCFRFRYFGDCVLFSIIKKEQSK